MGYKRERPPDRAGGGNVVMMKIRPPAVAALAALLLVLTLLASCARFRGPQRILLIVLDAARSDRVEEGGLSPHLDRLAQKGVVFTQHFAQGTATMTSIPKLLYSRYFAPLLFPGSAQVPFTNPKELFRAFDRQSISLPRALAAGGYHTALISAHSWFRAGTKLAGEFDDLYDLSSILDVDRRYGYPRAEQVVDFAIRWIEEHREEKLFIYLHLMDTHFPHYFDEDARSLLDPAVYDQVKLELFSETGRPKSLEQPVSGPERRYLDALYDGDLRYADRQLGRLIDALRVEGELDDTLIVITSDHGEHLLEEPGRFGHGGPWYDVVARIPLIVSYPDRLAPDRCDQLTESVDVMPTILELAGVDLQPDKKLDGRNLVALLRGREGPRSHVFGASAVRGRRYKAIWPGGAAVGLEGGETALVGSESGPSTPKLYDLVTDPGERRNLWASRRQIAEELGELYRRTMAPFYRRYLEARRAAPSEGAFAIGASHFECQPAASLIGRSAGEGAIDVPAAAPSGWVQSLHWNRFFLLAVGPATPVEIAFPLPSGAYLVSFSLRGTCEVELPGHDPRTLVEEPLADEGVGNRLVRTESVELGVAEFRGDRFAAHLRSPAPETPCFLRYIGFAPRGAGREPEEEKTRREYEERLETLGYID